MFKGFQFWLFMILAVTLALAPIVASADTSRGQFAVYVNVLRECRIGLPSLAADASTEIDSSYTVSGKLDMKCSRNTAYTVSLSSNTAPLSATDQVNAIGVGNGNTQAIPVNNNVPIRYNETNGAQLKTLVMTIDY